MGGLSRGEEQIGANWGGKLKKRRMTQYQHDKNLSNIVGLTDGHSSCSQACSLSLSVRRRCDDCVPRKTAWSSSESQRSRALRFLRLREASRSASWRQ